MHPVQPAPAAHSIACARCGGAVALHGLAPRVRCAHCGHDQKVPAQKLAHIAQYQQSAGAVVARLEGELAQRAQWERWYGPDGKPRRAAYVMPFVLFGSMFGVGALLFLLTRLDLLDADVTAKVAPGAMLGVYLLGFAGYFAFVYSRKARTTVAAARVGATCPRCGAPLAFEAGKAVERCAHCGAPLVASTTIMHAAVDVARADLRRASMERYRLERTSLANAYRASAATAMPYIVLGSFLPMTAGGAIAFTVDMLTDDKSNTPVEGLAVIWLMALLNAGLLVLVVALRRRRRDRWRAVADAVAARLHGRVSTTMAEWVVWLNDLWCGPYPVTQLLAGPVFHAVTGSLGAFPVAVDFDPVPADSQHGVRRVDVLVAACLPGFADGVSVPPDVQQRAQSLGFTASSCSGGFVAAGRAVVGTLKRSAPAAGADALVAAARLLVDWAARAGATPATRGGTEVAERP